MDEREPETEGEAGQTAARTTGLPNKFVRWLLGSPLHFLLSGSVCVVEYRGRMTGRRIATPTQYVCDGDNVIILVGSPQRKVWWRNFNTEDGHDVDLLVQREWLPMRGRAIVGAEEPEAISPLLTTYFQRFPKAARSLGGDAADAAADRAVVVWARPR